MTTVRDSIRKLGAGAGTAQPAVLEARPPQGAKPPVVGKGRTPASTAGGGANLVEASFTARTYWPTKTVQSADGLFVFEVKPVKKVTWQSGGTTTFAEPPA